MDEIAPWEVFIRSSALHHFVQVNEPWLWPLMQSLHYVGGSLLLGTVGLFDLRLLGFAKGVAPAALHRLIRFGIAGWCLNLMLGIVFFFGHPDQYFYNNSFRFKILFMTVAGLNILAFYGTDAYAQTKMLPAGAAAPARAKVIAAVSLAMWVAILICGRLITFFRPPFFH
jgi:hypothetical protein